MIIGTFLGGVWAGIDWDKNLVSQARLALKNEQVSCDMKLVAVETELQRAANEKRKAISEIIPVRVETPAEILDLCMRSASCRDSREKR